MVRWSKFGFRRRRERHRGAKAWEAHDVALGDVLSDGLGEAGVDVLVTLPELLGVLHVVGEVVEQRPASGPNAGDLCPSRILCPSAVQDPGR